jgi:deoxyuridine 5'-triphosphate nucleotidohydrolase
MFSENGTSHKGASWLVWKYRTCIRIGSTPSYKYWGGVIDGDYHSNVCVIIFNHSVNLLHIRHGDRIAQLICERNVYPDVCEVEKLDKTVRGSGGFGSSRSN